MPEVNPALLRVPLEHMDTLCEILTTLSDAISNGRCAIVAIEGTETAHMHCFAAPGDHMPVVLLNALTEAMQAQLPLLFAEQKGQLQ